MATVTHIGPDPYLNVVSAARGDGFRFQMFVYFPDGRCNIHIGPGRPITLAELTTYAGHLRPLSEMPRKVAK